MMVIFKKSLRIISNIIGKLVRRWSCLLGSLVKKRKASTSNELHSEESCCRTEAYGKNKIFPIPAIIVGGLLVIFMAIEVVGYCVLSQKKALWTKVSSNGITLEDKELRDLEKKNEKLVKKIKKLAPKGIYIIVDTAKNTLYLKKDNELLRKAVISTGNGNVLVAPGGESRIWIFDTPRGEFAVKYKLKDPPWIKPDWAFIEEGEEIPKKAGDRVEMDVLGEYAMGFGNGYFFHGTLYTRLLGRNATHGCIRLGDEDLEAVNKASTIGTKIFIF